MKPTTVAIIGAGPYALSLAAHLRRHQIDFRIFGIPMDLWINNMPSGMFLKSAVSASNLSDPENLYNINRYRTEKGIAIDDRAPLPLEKFVDYGLSFQQRFVPDLEGRLLVAIDRKNSNWELRFDDGTIANAKNVVIAVGVAPFKFVPASIASLPAALWSHSSDHGPFEHLGRKKVAIIGSGASAVDLAAIMNNQGVDVTIVSRAPMIRFQPPPPKTRNFYQKARWPDSAIGGGWKLLAYAELPSIFHTLPSRRRMHIVTHTLGPAPGYFMKEQLSSNLPLLLQHNLVSASERKDRVRVELTTPNGNRTLDFDHIVAATGYRIDVDKLDFLPALSSKMKKTDQAPALGKYFETSVPGIFFIGPSAAFSFGPVMRFVYGAEFTARRLSSHIVDVARVA